MRESGRRRLIATAPPILSDRLELVSVSPAVLEALFAGETATASRLLGAEVPPGWPPDGPASFLGLRYRQMQGDPSLQPWLVRALALRETREVVGTAGFHGPPGINGKHDPEAVELGYEVFEAFRGRGLATEAVSALMSWAQSEHGVRRFILSIAPGNAPSLAIAARLGFVQTGEQWDDEDGLELVFEFAVT